MAEFVKVVSVSLREDFFGGDMVRKPQVPLFYIVRRARYRCPNCLCSHPPYAVARHHYRRRGYSRLPSKLLLPDCVSYRPPSTFAYLHYCRMSFCRFPSLSPSKLLSASTMPTYEKQKFTHFKALKLAMKDGALQGETKFTYYYNIEDTTRSTVICVHDDCPFRTSAICSASKELVVVYSLDKVHTV